MNYEYTVIIPDGKRAQFRTMVKQLGGSIISGPRKIGNDDPLICVKVRKSRKHERSIKE